MKPLIRTFITNPVLVHMITIGVIVFGTFSFLTMPRELNPNLNFYWMIVEVWYPGVSPEEIEKHPATEKKIKTRAITHFKVIDSNNNY